MPGSRVRQRDFDLHTWVATIPMTDDVYLGLQAQNIARVEMSVLRRWESDVLDEQETDPGNYQGPKYRELLALSQMWVFGVYEFLRTWRQRARFLKQFEDKYKQLSTPAERNAYLKDLDSKVRDKARLATRFPVYYSDHVAKIADPVFMKSVRSYCDETEELWLQLSAVRMPAAKHELPKKYGQNPLIADAPGIGLPDRATGSILWQVLRDNKQTTIMRRDLADKFFGILGWHEDVETALLLANEAKARRGQLARQRSGGLAGSPPEAKQPDPFFRTKREVTNDEQPLAVVLAKGRDNRHGSSGPARTQATAERVSVNRSSRPGGKTAPKMDEKPSGQEPFEPLPYFVREVGGSPIKKATPPIAKRRYPRARKP